MIRKLFPLILGLIGLGAGIGAGVFLRHAPEEPTEMAEEEPKVPPDYVKLNNQFVVPVVEAGQVAALVVVSLSVDVTAGSSRLVPSGSGNKPPLGIERDARSGLYARLVDPNPEFGIRVSVQFETDAAGRLAPISPVVSNVLRDLQSAAPRGPRLVWVRDSDEADLALLVTQKSIYIRPKGTPLVTRGPETTVSCPSLLKSHQGRTALN